MAVSGDPILRTEGLDRWFGGVHALDGVDLEVERGSLHAIIGPNGSGKSTFFNLVTGHTRPNRGRVIFEGVDVTGRPYEHMVRRGIAKSYQITTVFPSLSVFENVRIAAQSGERRPYVFWFPAGRLRDVAAHAESVLGRVGLAGGVERRPGPCPTASCACSTWRSRSRPGRAFFFWTSRRRA